MYKVYFLKMISTIDCILIINPNWVHYKIKFNSSDYFEKVHDMS